MKLQTETLAKRVLLPLAAAVIAIMTISSPAAAATDDSFSVYTTNGCGAVDFVDYGAGAPGGGNNDDYAVVHDYCGDGHGVKAYAWVDGVYLGSRYNGNGLAGAAVVWDPFGNVVPGESVGLKICLSDGDGDPTPFSCHSYTYRSVDG